MTWGWTVKGDNLGTPAESAVKASWPDYNADFLRSKLAVGDRRFDPGNLGDVEKHVYLSEQVAGHKAEAEACLKREFGQWLQGTHEENIKAEQGGGFYENDDASGGPKRRHVYDGAVSYEMKDDKGTGHTGWQATRWGMKQLTHLDGVRDFLRAGKIKQDNAERDMNLLAERGPQDLNEAWMYFKHWVKKRPVETCDDYGPPGQTLYQVDRMNGTGPSNWMSRDDPGNLDTGNKGFWGVSPPAATSQLPPGAPPPPQTEVAGLDAFYGLPPAADGSNGGSADTDWSRHADAAEMGQRLREQIRSNSGVAGDYYGERDIYGNQKMDWSDDDDGDDWTDDEIAEPDDAALQDLNNGNNVGEPVLPNGVGGPIPTTNLPPNGVGGPPVQVLPMGNHKRRQMAQVIDPGRNVKNRPRPSLKRGTGIFSGGHGGIGQGDYTRPRIDGIYVPHQSATRPRDDRYRRVGPPGRRQNSAPYVPHQSATRALENADGALARASTVQRTSDMFDINA